MAAPLSKDVLAFQAARTAGAPRRWTYWVAVFTAINGTLLLTEMDLTFLAGLVAPFTIAGPAPHFAAAVVFAGLAFASRFSSWILLIPLLAYLADIALAAHHALWAGVVMHLVVLGLVGLALAAGRYLRTQAASDETRDETRNS
jgi:hypothetical protein